MITPFRGMPVFESELCTRKVYRFPPSKHRSARVHKKLQKRLGEQSYEMPDVVYLQGKIVVHPEVMKLLMDKIQ